MLATRPCDFQRSRDLARECAADAWERLSCDGYASAMFFVVSLDAQKLRRASAARWIQHYEQAVPPILGQLPRTPGRAIVTGLMDDLPTCC
jgi:hypothetical protein